MRKLNCFILHLTLFFLFSECLPQLLWEKKFIRAVGAHNVFSGGSEFSYGPCMKLKQVSAKPYTKQFSVKCQLKTGQNLQTGSDFY